MSAHGQLAARLAALESELIAIKLWADITPSRQALASTEPFAWDTLDFPEWLQFVFIPKLRELCGQRALLPEGSAVAPMAEEYFGLGVGSGVIELLRSIDQLLTKT